MAYLVYFNVVKADDFVNNPYNARQDNFAEKVIRGNITDKDGVILAQTDV